MIAPADDEVAAIIQRHVRAGWLALLLFAGLGLGVETLHGFKIAAYVDVSNETRRLMWTLAHAHGAALGLMNIAFATTVRLRSDARRRAPWASRCLLAATVLIPAGFFLGGCFIYDGDPGLGIVLVPMGGLLLLVALAAMAAAPPLLDDVVDAPTRREPPKSRRR